MLPKRSIRYTLAALSLGAVFGLGIVAGLYSSVAAAPETGLDEPPPRPMMPPPHWHGFPGPMPFGAMPPHIAGPQLAGPTPGICEDRFAREAGRRAYFAARLKLTTDQMPLWQKFTSAAQDAADKERQSCLAMASAEAARTQPHPPPEMLQREEEVLSARLASLHATRPAFDALYQALSPEQRTIFEPPAPPPPLPGAAGPDHPLPAHPQP